MVVTDSYNRSVEWFNGHISRAITCCSARLRFLGLIWMVERPIAVIQMPSLSDLEILSQRYLRERHVRSS